MFAVLHLPRFRLQAARRVEKAAESGAAALLDEESRPPRVTELSPAASQAGARAGMTPPQAVARCPEILLLRRSPEAENSLRDLLLSAAFTLGPRVEETQAGLCTADLRGSTAERARRQIFRIREQFQAIDLELQAGLAPSPGIAAYAARCADDLLEVNDPAAFLAGLPLDIAGPSVRQAAILKQWGIRTLADLTALPRQEVTLRLGPEGGSLWDRAGGGHQRVLRHASLPPELKESFTWEPELETLEPVLFILRRFVDQLALRLQHSHLAAASLRLRLEFSDRSEHQRLLPLPQPSAEPDLLFRLLHTHLENFRAASPLVALALELEPTRPLARQQDLFDVALRDPHRFSETLARLVALAGPECVGIPRLEPSHRPDAFRLEEVPAVLAAPLGEGQPEPAGLALRRFRPPLPARVACAPDGLPRYLESERVRGEIRAAQGPWTLSGEWWSAQTAWARQEWDVALLPAGLYRLVRQGEAWSVEGMYD